MKAWKRSLGMILSLIIAVGTLGNSGFTVMAADSDGTLRLAEGAEWVADVSEEDPAPAAILPEDETVSAYEAYADGDSDGTETEEAIIGSAGTSDEATAEIFSAENDDDTAAPAAEETEESRYDTAGPEWQWDEELDFDDRGNPTLIKKVIARLLLDGKEYEAEVVQGEEVRAINCIIPATYRFSARVTVDSQEYTNENVCAYGPVPSGHTLDLEWKLNTDDAAYPYYAPDWDKKLHCSVCGQEVSIFNDGIELLEGDDRPACDHDVTFRLGMWYSLKNEDGDRNDIRPFFAESPELPLPATGVHGFMRCNDTPWWDWHYNDESGIWSVEAVFWCGDENREMRFGEDCEEVTLTSNTADHITTYTATFQSDKFYNSLTHRLDRSVKFVTEKKVTENNFEISGVEDVLYTGKPVTFDNLWVAMAGRNLEEGIDYTAKYANNKNAGEASLTITGKGRFKGSVTLDFRILPVDLGTENFQAHDLSLIANGKVQKKASPLYWNGAVFAKSNYNVIFDDPSVGAYKEPGSYRVTLQAKNKNFKGSRTYRIDIMDPGSGNDKLIDAARVKLSIDPASLKANPWGDMDWDTFNERDESGKIKAYRVTYNNCDVTAAFQEHYADLDAGNGKGVLTVSADPMHWIEIKDRAGNASMVHFGGSVSKTINLSRTDISKLKITIPSELTYSGHSISQWDLLEHYGLEIIDEEYYERNEAGERIKKPLVLQMDEHYGITLKNNGKAGKMTVTINGRKGYTGKVTKTISIVKIDLSELQKNGLNDFDREGSLIVGRWEHSEEEDTDHFVMPQTIWFSKGGAGIDHLQVGYRAVNVWQEGETEHRDYYDCWLNPKTDYTVKYNYASKNPKAGEKAELVLSGKGNYTGSVSFSFDVAERPLWDNIVEAPAVPLGKKPAATMKPYLTRITVKDSYNGKVLQPIKDYTVEYYRPTFDESGLIKPESEWTRLEAGTRWSDVFAPGDENLQKDGHSLIARLRAVEGSGYADYVDMWYYIVKSPIKPADFQLKDQALAMNPWGDYEPGYYFMPGEEPTDIEQYVENCSDEEFKAWADKYFKKYPTDCRFYPDTFGIKNGEKPGTATVTIHVKENWGWDCNTGCRGGFTNVKFKVINKDVVK